MPSSDPPSDRGWLPRLRQKLEIEVTVDDAKAYTAPWTIKLNHRIKLDTELLEYVCLENEKSRAHLVGR